MAVRKKRKSTKQSKKQTPKKRKQKVETIWKNPKYTNQLREKLNTLAKNRQSDEESCISQTLSEDQQDTAESSKVVHWSENEEIAPEFQMPDLITPPEDQQITAEDSQSCAACNDIDTDFLIPGLTFAEYGRQAMETLHNMLTRSEVKFQKDLHKLEQDYLQNCYLPLVNVRRTLLDQTPNSRDGTEIKSLMENCTPLMSSGCRNAKNVKALLRRMARGEREKLVENFWPKVIRNSHPMLSLMLKPEDHDVLAHITDITVELNDVPENNSLRVCSACCNDGLDDGIHGFEIKFVFGPNPYFENEVLRKCYVISIVPEVEEYLTVEAKSKNMLLCEGSDEEESEGILDYKGPRLIAIQGTTIEWCSDFFKGSHQVVCNPIFSYFQRSWDRASNECDDLVQQDYQLGCYFRDTMIPRAYALYHRPTPLTNECLHDATRKHIAVEVKPGTVDLPEEVLTEETPTATTSKPEETELTSNSPDDNQEENDVTYEPETSDVGTDPLAMPLDDLEQRRKFGEEANAPELDEIVSESEKEVENVSDMLLDEPQEPKSEENTNEEQVANYDEVDDAVLLPPDYDQVDDMVCIPPKKRRLFGEPEETKVKPREQIYVPESISASRRRMELVMGRVNTLLRERGQYVNGIELDTSELNSAIRNGIQDAMRLNQMNEVESDLPLSEDMISLEGNLAEDEEDWSDLSPPSVNTEMKDIFFQFNNGVCDRKWKLEDHDASKASSQEFFCRDSSDSIMDDVTCLSRRTVSTPDVEAGFFNFSTPSTSGSDVEESEFLHKSNKRKNKDTESGVPLCSTGVVNNTNQQYPLDYDSEAPSDPPEEIDYCKQQ